MKTVTSYLSLILSLLFVVSCGDTGPYFVPNKPEVIKPGVTSHFVHIVLDISPLPISTICSGLNPRFSNLRIRLHILQVNF